MRFNLLFYVPIIDDDSYIYVYVVLKIDISTVFD